MKPIFIFLSLIPIHVFGQVPSIEWQKRYGGSGQNLSYSSQQGLGGNYVIGGRSNSEISGDKTENSRGNYDYWILKCDGIGNILSDKTIGGGSPPDFNGQDIFRSVSYTEDGGYVVSGYSNSPLSGDKSENAINDSDDFWVVKVNPDGEIAWQNTIGGDERDEPFAMLQTLDGGYIVGGFSNSSISGDKSEDSRGFSDFWILKLNSLGEIEWQKTYGGLGYEAINSIVETAFGYLLCGSSDSNISGEKAEPCRGFADYWIVAIGVDGGFLWQKTIGGSGTDSLRKVITSNDGGYLLAGYSNSSISGEKTDPQIGLSDYWVVKVDAVGVIQWQRTYGGTGDDFLYSASSCTDGGYILTGSSDSPISGSKSEPTFGGRDSWTLKIDSFGNILWQKTLGGIGDDGFNAVQQTIDGGYLISGSTNSPISGSIDQAPRGIYDYWVLKLTPEHLQSYNFNNQLFCSVFPNPIVKTAHIVLSKTYNKILVTVSTITGQIIQKGYFLNTSNIDLDIEGMSGVYFLNISDENSQSILKIIKK